MFESLKQAHVGADGKELGWQTNTQAWQQVKQKINVEELKCIIKSGIKGNGGINEMSLLSAFF